MSEGRSIREWTDDLDIELRDTSGSQQVWSFAEKYRAIQEGFRKAKGWYRTQDVYESITLVSGQREYALPPYVQNIRMVEHNNVLSLNPGRSSSEIVWQPLRSWWVVASPETNRLWVDEEYPGAGVRIYYEQNLVVPPLETTLWTNISSTNTFIPVANTSAFKTWNWPAPGYVVINNEVIRYEMVTATSFTGLTRGAFNTAPRANSLGMVMDSMARGLGFAHTSNVAVTPFIAMPLGGAVDQYINNVARQQLYLYRMNDTDSEGNRAVATLANEWGRQAAEVRKENRPFKWPRLMQIRFPRRR